MLLTALLACNGGSPADTTDTADTADTATDGVGVGVVWDEADFAHVYDIGPGQTYETPEALPWESLEPSTLVRIHRRDAPYAAKWVISTAATEAEPVVVLGVDGPVITGEDASTRQELDYWNEDRSIIKIGGSSSSPDTPSWVHLQGLTIQSGHPDYAFTDDAGSPGTYTENAACVFIESGSHITIRDSVLTDCGNGLFVSDAASDVLIAQNYIHGNGIVGDAYEHNAYTEALGITYEYNRFGPLREGADGNNLKDRSAGTVIRYNWIEGGNRQLDLVDSDSEALLSDPAYATTEVYGNVLIEPDGDGNSQVIHYGGDSGETARYRGGLLLLHHNTVVSERTGNTTLLRLSSTGESADIRNNVITTVGALAILAESGSATVTGNLLSPDWRDSFEGSLDGTVTDGGNLEADADLDGDHRPTGTSPAVGAAVAEHPDAAAVTMEYVLHRDGTARSAVDLGALSAP
jgi:hypothetical protein